MTPRLLQVAFWTAITFTFFSGVLPEAYAPHVPLWDKAVHSACFFVLAVLGMAAHPQRATPVLAGLAAFGGLIEVVQAFPAIHRDADVLDWIADLVGLAAASATWLFALPRIRRAEMAGR